MLLKELFNLAASSYDGGENEFNTAAEILRNKLPKVIGSLLGKHNYIIKGSVGIGGKAETPWVAILNPDITKTTQKGYYIVYLLDVGKKNLYLSLAVGWTQFSQNYSLSEATSRIQNYSSYLLRLVHSRPQGFVGGPIDLTAKGNLSKGYQYGQIFSRKYKINKLPSEKSLHQDLFAILKTYSELSNIAGSDISNIDYELVRDNKKMNKTDKEINKLTLENDINIIKNKLQELVSTEPPIKRTAIIRKAVRNPKIARLVKERENFICEICRRQPFIQKNGLPYAEADHIVPLGLHGRGLDTPENMRCLCAQCHAVITFGSDGSIKDLLNK